MMKTFTLLLVALVLQSFGANSQMRPLPTGNLTIFSEDGSPFYLILNGQRYNDKAQTNVRIELLPNPYYDCKVIFANKKIPTLSKTIDMTDVDDIFQDVTYRIKKDRKGRRVLRFYSSIEAEQNNVRPANCAVYHYGSPNDMYIGPDGTQYHQEVVVQTTTNDSYGMNVNMPGFGMSVNVPGEGVTTTTTTTTTTTGGNYSQNGGYNNGNNNGGYNNGNGQNNNGNNNGGYNNNGQNNNNGNGGYNNNNNGGYNNGNNNGGYNNNNGNNQNNGNANNNSGTTTGCRAAMNSTDFEDACSTIKSTSFDDTRLSTAKLVLSSNCVSTNQVITLIKMLSFEANKLDLAKYAYGYCVERNNYFKVVNAFSFDSSKNELNEYIKDRK